MYKDKVKKLKIILLISVVITTLVGLLFLSQKRDQPVKTSLAVISEKRDFKVDEDTEFQFKYLKAEAVLAESIKEDKADYWESVNIDTEIKDPEGKGVHTTPEISFEENGEFSVKIEKPSMLKPGVYSMKIRIEDDSGDSKKIKEIEQEFTWGVLAINTNKSIYIPGERSYLQMAVLDTKGHTICDANLELRIKNQQSKEEMVLSTEEGMIEYSGECLGDNVVDKPDYFAYYQVEEIGKYEMNLINLDTGYQITDSFEVRTSVPFNVERTGPTRIYPFVPYEMTFKIKANQDFEGQIIETVSERFEILNPELRIKNQESSQFIIHNLPFLIQNQGNAEKALIWQDVVLTQGDELEIRYSFDAPDIYPYLYLLGPLTMKQLNNETIFSEERQWQIASDASTPGLIGYADGTGSTPKYQVWNGSSFDGENNASTSGSNMNWVVVKSSPTDSDNKIMGTLGSGDSNLYIQEWDGNSWVAEWNTSVGASDIRYFDIAYEQSSGDAIVVWGDGTNDLEYRKRVSGSWDGSDTNVPTALGDTPYWVRLTPDPGSNEIMLGVIANDQKVYAKRWDGSAWGNHQTMDNSAATKSYECMDIAYERASGDAFVIWGDSSNNIRYREFVDPNWQSEQDAYTGMDDSVVFLDAATAQVSTNTIAIAMVLNNENVEFGAWDGSTPWETRPSVQEVKDKSSRMFSVAFEKTEVKAMFALHGAQSGTDNKKLYWRTWTPAGGFTSLTEEPNNVSGVIKWVQLHADPLGSDDDMLVFTLDDTDDLDYKKWNGSSWTSTWTEVDAAINGNTYEPFMFAWDNALSTIDISGTVYTNEGVTTMDSGRTVRLKINGQGTYSDDTDTSGNYSITGVSPPSVGDEITVFLDGASEKAVTISKASSTNDIVELKLYQNRVIITDGGSPATSTDIENMAVYDNSNDPDIMFTASTGASTSTTIFAGNKLYIWPGRTFNAGGSVATLGGDTTSSVDGDLHIAAGSTYIAAALTTTTVGGSWIASSSATFTHNNASTTFTATSTGKEIWTEGSSDFYDIVFNGSGGEWTFKNSATTTNDFVLSQGTVTSTSDYLDIGNNFTNSGGIFDANSGIVRFYATDSGNQITTNGTDFYQLLFDGTDGDWTFTDNATSTATTTINKGSLSQGNNLHITFGGLYIETTGTFFEDIAGSGVVYFERTADADPAIIDDAAEDNGLGDVYIGTSPGTVKQNSDIVVDSLTVNSGDTHDTRGYEIDATSSITIYGTLNATDGKENDGTIIYLQTDWTNTGTFTAGDSTTTFDGTTENNTIAPGGSDFYNIDFNGSGGGWEFTSNSATATNNFWITQGTATSASEMLYVGGSWLTGASGTFLHNNSTTTFDSSDAETIDPGESSFYNVEFNHGTGDWTFNSDATTTNNFTITQGTVTAPSGYLDIRDSFKNAGTFTNGSGIVRFYATDSGNTITPGGSDFYSLYFDGSSGSWTFTSNSATATDDFYVYQGEITSPSEMLYVGGSWLVGASGTFTHNNSTTTFDSTDGGETIDPGESSFYNVDFNDSGGGWTFSSHATATNNFFITQGTVTAYTGYLDVGNNFSNAGTFTHNDGTVRFYATDEGHTINQGASSFGTTTFDGSGGGWEFITNSATTTGNFNIYQGTATSASEMLYVGGSWYNAGTFLHNNATTTFNSSDTGENINPGSSSFYNVDFNNSGGGWTITNDATSTNNWFLTNAAGSNGFIVNSNVRIEIKEQFSNELPGAETTWNSGSLLYLNSGTAYTVNSKAVGDAYKTLQIGVNTDIRMWNSSSSIDSYTIDVSSSLYSQDHGGTNGDLYIFGDYNVSDGSTDYWSYATDFDGADLSGGSERQCNVRLAANSTTTVLSGKTLEVLGGSANTSTTINRQGDSGNYAIRTMEGATINFQYYQIRNINSYGLNLTASSTVTSLNYGDFLLELGGATMITVSSSTIDQNVELTITGSEFSSSTGAAATLGYNVTETGTASSYWFFSVSIGNYDGEDYDSDQGGDPGYIRWDDSATTTLTQWYYRWYDNVVQLDPVTPLAATNTTTTNATSGTVFRLRINIQVGNLQLDAGTRKFILQYASSTSCSAVSESNWTEIGGLAADYTSVWRGYNNAGIDDGDTITSLLLVDRSDVKESYEETSPSVNNPNAIPASQAGEWDWVLQYNAAYSSRTYCFRMAKSNGDPFDTYTNYPEIVTYQAATWKEAEDASGSAATGTDIRLRFQLVNTGDATATDYNYQIEYVARSGDTCGDETFIPMPILNTSSTSLFEMTTSSFFRYQDPTTHQLSPTSTYPFNTGQLVETYATTGDMDVGDVSLSEAEYVFHISTTTPEGYYCFRVTNDGTVLDNYNVYGVLYIGTVGVNLSGTIYTNEGVTTYGCDGTELTVTAKVNGAGSYEGTCTESNGNYTISDLTASAGDVITVFLNGETEKAVAVTRSINGNTDISGLDLYEDRVILRNDDGVALTIEDMAQYDGTATTSIMFTATTTNGTATTTTIFAGNKLYIWPDDSFSPGGEVKVLANADSEPSGSLHIATGATFTACSPSTCTAGSGITVSGSWIASSTATFTHNNSTTTFTATTTGKKIWTEGNSDFYNIDFNGSGGGWEFESNSATATNNFFITQGTATSASGMLYVGGSWYNAGTFTHNNATTVFNSADTGETINPGSSSFYNVDFDNTGGGWRILSDATSTNNWFLTNAAGSNGFIVDSNVRIEVKKQFSNELPGTETTWNSGSLLYLNSGTAYTVNSKTVGDIYENLEVGVNTDIRMWNSSSSIDSHTVDSSGSLYSQDHGGVNGDLYIFGDYHIPAGGTDYWTYESDFDGTAAADRQVNVRLAANSTTTFNAGETLHATGTASASTTIDRQESGNYALKVEGGTLNMEYYEIRNTNENGLWLIGSPDVTSLDYGDYGLSVEGGTMMTVTSAVIDANNPFTIQGSEFSTTSDLSVAYNVTEIGTPSSYWTFAGHYGNLDGEDYDSDPGDPSGYIRWDDSGITVSGIIYTNEGVSAYDCAGGDNLTVKIELNGAGDYTDVCDSGDGSYSVTVPVSAANDVLTAFIDGHGSFRAVTITKASSTDDAISGLDLYQNRVIVKHEDAPAGPITIADMAYYDANDDSDIKFTATTTDGTATTTTIFSGNKLYIWPDKTFNASGTITIQGNADGEPSGSLHIAQGATLTACPASDCSAGNSITLSGSWIASSSATFTHNDIMVTFQASTTGKNIWTEGSSDFYDIVFNGSGGEWTFKSVSATATNDFTITQGTVTSTSGILYVGDNWDNSGTFDHNSGTVLFNATDENNTIVDGGSAFYLINFNGAGGTWLYQDGASVSPATTTVQNGTSTFLNTKTGSVDVTGGYLLVDWYLGAHLIDASNTATNIDTDGCEDITITEASASSTVWGYIEGTGWDGPYNSTTTGTGVACGGASGINPQPGSTTAIRIREYKKTATETFYYKYNLQVEWQTNYGEYDYYDDYGSNYLTSASSTQSSGVDKVITETWHRTSSSTINSPYTCSAGSGNQCINQPPDNGSWYAGMRSGLLFEIVSGLNVDFGELKSSNDWTAKASSTLEVTTSASNGYVVTAWAINEARMKLSSFDIYISKYDTKNDSPKEWDETCSPQNPNCCGFGFSTDDSDLSGGTANRFTSGGGTTCAGIGASGTRAYSGFATSTETVAFNPVADLSNPTTTDRTIITYKISADSAQAAGQYQTTVIYICTANY